MALSRREVEVLQLIAQGASTETVARRLFISVKTVKNHLANIYDKMDTTDRTQAVVAGLKLGLVRLR
jgi:DNA-binding NarL/FixJ family response regulator